MNREEKEVVVAFVIAIDALAAVCILSFETCVTGFVIAVTVSLWTFAWILFGGLLREATERQDTGPKGENKHVPPMLVENAASGDAPQIPQILVEKLFHQI
jgi:hypothetical protein